MGMHKLEDDSPLAERLIAIGKDITQLVREAVTADRHSKNCSRSAHPNRWTKAAQNRDEAVRILREKLRRYSEEI